MEPGRPGKVYARVEVGGPAAAKTNKNEARPVTTHGDGDGGGKAARVVERDENSDDGIVKTRYRGQKHHQATSSGSDFE